ncbi:MAG: M1 family metallopeptidase [Bacteroidota bacterium]
MQKLKEMMLVLCLLMSTVGALAQKMNSYLADPNGVAREHQLDLERMKLDVAFEPEKGMVKGTVTYYFQPIRQNVDTIFFDAPKIKIEEVKLNGTAVKFTTNDAGLTIFPSSPLHWKIKDSISIKYNCTPRRGIYFIGWNDTTNRSRKQIWTQGQGVDNRYWIPSYDDMNDKLITETIVTMQKDYSVLSNGTLISEVSNSNGTKTWHHAMTHPHSSYLVMLGIGKYEIKKGQSANGVKLNNYYYPDQSERVEPTYRATGKMMDFLEEETGLKYPWESYSQIPVQDFMFGAMENTTATVYGDFLFVDERAFLDRSYMGVNAHEMTHQWFGDYVTAISNKHNWLQESFATYYSKLFMKSYYGQEQYEWNRRGEHNAALGASKTDRNPVVHTGGGGARSYQKGSAVLDMLRYVAGDEQFKYGISYYLNHHPYSNVETNDLYRAFMDAMGLNYDWFFDEWLYKGGEPVYDVSYEDITAKDGNEFTDVKVMQTQSLDEQTGLFKMPINFIVMYKDGSSDSKREMIEKQTTTVRILNANHKKIDFVLFDPGSVILKTLNFTKSLEELKSQALKAPNMIDRYDAVLGLKTFTLNEKRETLIEVFKKEKFHAIKSEILSQLAGDMSTEITTVLFREALKDKDNNVRLAALNNMADMPQSLQENAAALLKDSSYSIVETAMDLLCNKYPNYVPIYLETTKNINGMGNSVLIKWLEINCFYNIKNVGESYKQLVDMTSNAFEFRTRVNAMNALQRLNYLNESMINNLFDACMFTNSRLANPSVSVLDYFYKTKEMKTLIQKVYKTRKLEDWQKTILERYSK